MKSPKAEVQSWSEPTKKKNYKSRSRREPTKKRKSKAEVRDDALQKKKKNSKVQGRSRSEPTKKRKRNPVQGRSRSEPTKREQVQGQTNWSKRSKVEANRKNLKKRKTRLSLWRNGTK